ncbi:MAG: class I mannose-6-phosphate isomerase [Clostridia bacterium]|nr:class I mannose-6-phosphate isomerase [Clostridia bacterium]
MDKIYPLKLTPVLKDAIWGGYKLADKYGAATPGTQIAENWCLTVRDDGMSVIENGPYAGLSLGEYLKGLGRYTDTPFPILIKFIDAKTDLSVQVHPDDDFARIHENDSGKTEMWYITEADEGAQIVYGLKENADKNDLLSDDGNTIRGALNYIDVKAGDVYYIPSGLVHALCGGITIAEIQQSSDLTYRLYDYGRIGKDGKPRELHTEKAIECIKNFSDDDITALRYKNNMGKDISVIASSEYFTVKKLSLSAQGITLNTSGKDCSLVAVDGEGEIISGVNSYKIKKGESYFLPLEIGEYSVRADKMVNIILSYSNH